MMIYSFIKKGSKVYLMYDSVHLIKNVRNNLLNSKRFVFPAFSFESLKGMLTLQVVKYHGRCYIKSVKGMRNYLVICGKHQN